MLHDGEAVYRSVGARIVDKKVFVAITRYTADGITYTVRAADQPMAWTDKEEFTSPSSFASACARVYNGDTEAHEINGWNVCYVIRGGHKYFLCDLRAGKHLEPELEPEPEDRGDPEACCAAAAAADKDAQIAALREEVERLRARVSDLESIANAALIVLRQAATI